ncbi:unnamed protein product [Paramecium octaurelia]|uniref:Uncharacterized protein n=1 Tax=Paramecium octaurelia TaxID=43137 RepID=A0A8S1VDI6_PAROT|nr:unnamed protein product [Paramecium octaurelia]
MLELMQMIQFLLQTVKMRISLFVYSRKIVDYGTQIQIKHSQEYFLLNNIKPDQKQQRVYKSQRITIICIF